MKEDAVSSTHVTEAFEASDRVALDSSTKHVNIDKHDATNPSDKNAAAQNIDFVDYVLPTSDSASRTPESGLDSTHLLPEATHW